MLDSDPEDREVAPGLRVVHTPGHTPGHRSVVLDAGTERILLTGDLLHLPIQAANPSWTSSHDEDAEAGARSRAAMLGSAADGSLGHRRATLRAAVRAPHAAAMASPRRACLIERS